MHDLMTTGYPVKEQGEEEKKRENVSSRIRNYEWAAEDYDRRYGKGSFFRKHPDSKKLLDELYEQKVACM
ncbi:MAG: hypothetical protein L0312_23340, partial [Acidobacteria bacterium]|nr:hypothetical protein [Acidobacteriota bacterium]